MDLTFAAHPDDDLLMMSPDVTTAIRAGRTATMVYVTAGEFQAPAGMDQRVYAAMRQDGLRAAYASVCGVPDNWSRHVLTTGTGAQVEEDILVARPTVRLVFMSVNDYVALDPLWSGQVTTANTIIPDGSPVTAAATYTRAQLIASLTWLMAHYAPTVIRTLNPEPVSGFPSANPDHQDHTATARFVDKATESYHGPSGSGRFIVRNYRGYDIGYLPVNLTPDDVATKYDDFHTYTDHDPATDPDTTFYQGLVRRCIPRWPSGTVWTEMNLDRSMEAYAVLDGRVARWRQTAGGGPWSGPTFLNGPVLAPYVSVSCNPTGRIQVFAIGRNTYDLLAAQQVSPGGDFGAWSNLGNPNGSGVNQTGVPSVLPNSDGRLQFFLRNRGGGISGRWQTWPNFAWSGWGDFLGTYVQDGLSIALSADGRLEVYATTAVPNTDAPWAGVRRLYQVAPNDRLAWANGYVATNVASGPGVGANADGRLQLFCRQGGTARVRTYWAHYDGSWAYDGIDLGDPGGFGELAVTSTSGPDARLVAFCRNAGRGVSMIYQTAANGGFNDPWVDLGGEIEQLPTVALDTDGRLVLMTLDPDCRLRIRTQKAAEAVPEFGDWQTVG